MKERALWKIAREGGDPFAARQQVCWTRHPEVTRAVSETLALLRQANICTSRSPVARAGDHTPKTLNLKSSAPTSNKAGPPIRTTATAGSV